MRRVPNPLTCPHCLESFRLERMLWIAKHVDSPDDRRLANGKARFLPDRFALNGKAYDKFALDGKAIDQNEVECNKLACPNCLGVIPREVFEMPTIYCSIVGAPTCGKSYVLTSMRHRLEETLARDFNTVFRNADTTLNHPLTVFRKTLFKPRNLDNLVRLDKTPKRSELVTEIRMGEDGVNMVYAKPFVFALTRRLARTKKASKNDRSFALCLYDNSGEDYVPGMEDDYQSCVAAHLAKSGILMLLIDPTQDSWFRDHCKKHSQDPQLSETDSVDHDQLEVINAAANRFLNMRDGAKHGGTLLVLLTKYDIWQHLLKEELRDPWDTSGGNGAAKLDCAYIEKISGKVRAILARYFRGVIAMAENLCDHVLYLPISATGTSPEPMKDGRLGFRPRKIKPVWVEVPVLYSLCKGETDMID